MLCNDLVFWVVDDEEEGCERINLCDREINSESVKINKYDSIFNFVIDLAFSKQCLDVLNKTEGGKGEHMPRVTAHGPLSLSGSCKMQTT